MPHNCGVIRALPRRGRSNDGSQDLPLSRRDSDGATDPPAGTVAKGPPRPALRRGLTLQQLRMPEVGAAALDAALIHG